MELSPETKHQIDTVLRIDKWTKWGVGIALILAFIAMISMFSYDVVPNKFMYGFFGIFVLLLLLPEVVHLKMWRGFLTNHQARRLLSLRFAAYLIGVGGLGFYAFGTLSQSDYHPQTIQSFLLSQAFFWGARYFGKWLERIIQQHDEHYMTTDDIEAIKEVREMERG